MEGIPDNNITIFSIGIYKNSISITANTEATFYLFLGEQIGYAKLVPLYPIGSLGSCYKLNDGIKYQTHTMTMSEIIPTKDNISEGLICHKDKPLFNGRTADRPW
jgi:hypothetical protein